MRETPLAEVRSVDDQAEWLDDGHVLYGLDGAVWSVRADGGAADRRRRVARGRALVSGYGQSCSGRTVAVTA